MSLVKSFDLKNGNRFEVEKFGTTLSGRSDLFIRVRDDENVYVEKHTRLSSDEYDALLSIDDYTECLEFFLFNCVVE